MLKDEEDLYAKKEKEKKEQEKKKEKIIHDEIWEDFELDDLLIG